jgi:hypothetical protein
MIGQCLLNKNESATVSKSKKFLDLNKALPLPLRPILRESKLPKKNLTSNNKSITTRKLKVPVFRCYLILFQER